MPALTTRQANRRYHREFAFAMAAYVVLVIATPFLIRDVAPEGLARAALAIAPAAPIALVFFTLGRWLAAVDEYVRARAAGAMLAGAAIIVTVATAWDFLRVYVGAPAPPAFFFGPGFFAAWGLSHAVLALKDRAGQGEGA